MNSKNLFKKLFFLFFVFLIIQSCCEDNVSFYDVKSIEVRSLDSNTLVDTIKSPFQVRVDFRLENSKCKDGSAEITDFFNKETAILTCDQSLTINNEIVEPESNLLDIAGVKYEEHLIYVTINFDQAFLDKTTFQNADHHFNFFISLESGVDFTAGIVTPVRF